MSVKKDASLAPGQFAGYQFQVERAVLMLAKVGSDCIVGIETLDDVAAISPDGSQVREQDKSTVTKRNPLSDRSIELWKTLGIWLDAVAAGRADPVKTSFVIATTQEIPQDALVRQIADAESSAQLDACIVRIRAAGKDPTDDARAHYARVLKHPDAMLRDVFSKVALSDAITSSHGPDLVQEVFSALHLPATISPKEIFDALHGWVAAETLRMIRAGEEAWIPRHSFDNQLFRLTDLYRNRTVVERAKGLIAIAPEDVASHRERTFVRQLHLIFGDTFDGVTDCIEDFLRAVVETTRLVQEGDLTPQDFENFYTRLQERWKHLQQIHHGAASQSSLDQEGGKEAVAGIKLYHETIFHREPLADRMTTEYYLTKGSYHRLADDRSVGWHPRFSDLLERNGSDNDGARII
jgi:hypothetical protein